MLVTFLIHVFSHYYTLSGFLFLLLICLLPLGFNSILRCGNITHHEYIQVGKGRDIGLNQISLFEAKVACGNGEQTLSRDIYRLGHHFDFFRMMSCYFTTVGFYVSLMVTFFFSLQFHGDVTCMFFYSLVLSLINI